MIRAGILVAGVKDKRDAMVSGLEKAERVAAAVIEQRGREWLDVDTVAALPVVGDDAGAGIEMRGRGWPCAPETCTSVQGKYVL